MISRSALVVAAGGNVLTWIASVNWGSVTLAIAGVVTTAAAVLTKVYVDTRTKIGDARIAQAKAEGLLEDEREKARLARGEAVAASARRQAAEESEARIADARRANEAKIADLRAWQAEYEASPKSRIDELTRQIAEQNDSLAKARKTLHELNAERQAEQNRRLEEQQVLTQQLRSIADESRDLREENRELSRRIAELTRATGQNTDTVQAIGEQVGRNAEAARQTSAAVAANAADIATHTDEIAKLAGDRPPGTNHTGTEKT